ncbi:MAG: UDP-N-acetylglucosamine--N-acetylmuramyl-(pentapeptide) pyrophosphoryl-undecaprenol N-acetylglucosamine transferase [Patescibacteria group bacterium]|nr:UDP-N-acetylglucosamine--N-acetylmuramyl-(pentapeptide) pyrophosphoryl-undecaprenol N-acetylglucosamine transferase [Patescibacteria group bacterium]
MTRILLTGGHAATTALSVIRELKKTQKAENIFWVGAKRAIEGSNVSTLESKIFPREGIKCYEIISGRIQRRFTRYTIISLLRIPIGFVHALFILLNIKPDVILSFGGYAAFPVVVMGFFLRIPVVIHEQTIAAGRANLFSAKFASKITLARKESKKYFPNGIVVGNPLLPSLCKIAPKKDKPKRLTIYITGGSRGSIPLNQTVLKVIDKLLRKYNVIHQTGELGYDEVLSARNKLSFRERNAYQIYATIDPNSIHEIWQKASIVIARSGANTVAEAIATKTPSIFVPLSNTYNDEQTKNAIFAQDLGIALVLPEKDLNPENLLNLIEKVDWNWSKMISKISSYKNKDLKAASRICEIILGFSSQG